MTGYVHIIGFKIKPERTLEERQEFVDGFLSMQKTCLKDGKPYILRIMGGIPDTAEHRSHGGTQDIEYVFVVEFASEEDCDRYHADPAHHAFFSLVRKNKGANGIVLPFKPF